jgi:hypothetical protein
MSAVLVALGTHIPERRDHFRIRYRTLGRPVFETGDDQESHNSEPRGTSNPAE